MLDIPRRVYDTIVDPKIYTVRGNTALYPASASITIDGERYGACKRQEWYRWFKYEATERGEPEYRLTAITGEAIHEKMVEFLREHTAATDIVVMSAEQSFYDPVEFISGRIDILLKDLKSGAIHGCDIKTVGDYKSGTVIEQPSVEHILQCAIYLDQYNKSATIANSKKVEDWIILYIARGENYKLKKYPHGSVFKFMWQFSIDLSKGYVTVTNQMGSSQEYPDITMENIYKGYRDQIEAIKKKELPPRDYEWQYSEEKLVGMLKLDKLNKTESAVVKKWMDDGAKPGTLELDKGDFQCRFCEYKGLCYSPDPLEGPKKKSILYKETKLNETPTKTNSKIEDIFEGML